MPLRTPRVGTVHWTNVELKNLIPTYNCTRGPLGLGVATIAASPPSPMTNAQFLCSWHALQRFPFFRTFSLIHLKKSSGVGPTSGMGVHPQHSNHQQTRTNDGKVSSDIRNAVPGSAPKLDRHGERHYKQPNDVQSNPANGNRSYWTDMR